MKTIYELQKELDSLQRDYTEEMRSLRARIEIITDQYNHARDRILFAIFANVKETKEGDSTLTMRQAAQYLSLSYSAVRKQVMEGTIPYFKVGGAIRFSREELDKYKRGEWTSPSEKAADEYLKNHPAKSMRLK